LRAPACCVERGANHDALSLAFLAPEIVKAAIEGRLACGAGISRLPIFQHLGANSSDSLESLYPRRIDAWITARRGMRVMIEVIIVAGSS
jgi:hypothetical protein